MKAPTKPTDCSASAATFDAGPGALTCTCVCVCVRARIETSSQDCQMRQRHGEMTATTTATFRTSPHTHANYRDVTAKPAPGHPPLPPLSPMAWYLPPPPLHLPQPPPTVQLTHHGHFFPDLLDFKAGNNMLRANLIRLSETVRRIDDQRGSYLADALVYVSSR